MKTLSRLISIGQWIVVLGSFFCFVSSLVFYFKLKPQEGRAQVLVREQIGQIVHEVSTANPKLASLLENTGIAYKETIEGLIGTLAVMTVGSLMVFLVTGGTLFLSCAQRGEHPDKQLSPASRPSD